MKAGGIVDRIAYAWSFEPPPAKRSICPLFWRTVFALIFVWPFVPLGFVLGFIFAARPAIFESDRDEFGRKKSFRVYAWWPTLDGKEPLSPIIVVALFALAALVLGGGGWLIGKGVVFLWHLGVILALAIGAVITGAGLYFWPKIQESEPYRLTADYLKAKKAKVCPEVVFEGRRVYREL